MLKRLFGAALALALSLSVAAAGTSENVQVWSTTAGSNTNADSSINWAELMSAAAVDNSARSMMAAFRKWLFDNGGIATGGSSNSYTVTTNEALSLGHLTTGLCLRVKANHTNTGASTANIDTLGTKDIETLAGGALSAGAMLSGGIYDWCWNSTNNGFTLLNSSLAPATLESSSTMTSTDAGATAAPVLTFDRNSASPAASDLMGEIFFNGRDSGANAALYAHIYSQIIDPTNGSEDGRLVAGATIAGTATDVLKIGPGIQIGAPTGGDLGAGTANVDTEIYRDGIVVGRVDKQVFTASGTYTPTSGMKWAVIECVGAGGNGGGATCVAGEGGGGGGGGSGGYSRAYTTAAAVGASQTVTVGATAAAASSVGTICVANGGGNGTAGDIGVSLGTGGAAATAGTGDVTIPGTAGQGGTYNTIVTVSAKGGNGAPSYFGGGGRGEIEDAAAGSDGGTTAGTRGGGGGGCACINAVASCSQTNFGAGIVVITEHF